MVYLTFGDQPSGVYRSQVLDLCRFLEEEMGEKCNLVAMVSLRGYMASRRKIKSQWKRSWVVPALPGMKFWALNLLILVWVFLFVKSGKVMARGILAANLALRLRKLGFVGKVIYDGRGAVHAEWKEYDVGIPPSLQAKAKNLEAKAVLRSDFRLAVSAELVKWWQKSFSYAPGKEIVVPCTLASDTQLELPDASRIESLRKERGWHKDDIVLVYSGSAAGWQSLTLVDDLLQGLLSENATLRVLFLAKVDLSKLKTYTEFPERVSKDWLAPEKVQGVLSACDYGILYRETSVTNQVAAPTKFAEYLAAGLPVLISEGIGDYSSFVIENQAGKLLPAESEAQLQAISHPEKQRMLGLAKGFRKEAYREQYQRLLDLS